MKNNYSHSAIKPEVVQSIGTPEKPLYQINFDTEEVTTVENDESSSSGEKLGVQYRSLYVQVSTLEYETLVSAIVGCAYDSRDIEAILLNNFEAQDEASNLAEDKRAEYIAEYKALQAWRVRAKEIAKSIKP